MTDQDTRLNARDLVRQWQSDRSEFFKVDIVDIVVDFAEWNLARSPDPEAAKLREENARMKLLVRVYVDPFEVRDDMLPLVEAINAEFDAKDASSRFTSPSPSGRR